MASVTARRLVRTNVFLRCLALPLTELKFARTWTNVFHRFGHPHANRASWGNGNESWNKLRVQEMLCRAAQETSGQRYIFITLTMTHSPFSVSVPGFSYIQPPASVLATTSTLLSPTKRRKFRKFRMGFMQSKIYLIDKTLSGAKYKPWTTRHDGILGKQHWQACCSVPHIDTQDIFIPKKVLR